ncbi:biotin biosynthesis protein BioY [Enterococcus plantarum]|uniref:Biotin transporter n=1 Tax=Enterococcus plantarum TaxID=1077675 RepID=A0A2W3ZNG3_9ENTE|nr:biotin transporter BioY [Enterococcus plantarum]MBO0422427.1 biotin transporter BioY [Enterococcus plantarum]OEG08861.1 biotin biosynthesis protein BioY [Enterococcus plantarum]PZL70413.1 biotin transporter BioY [Enterococcus plantarum]
MKTKDITKIAIMISIIIVLGFFPPIPISLLPVPIVIQNAGFMLSGLLLGKKNGTIATVLFLLLVAIGFPVLAGGRGGMMVFFGVTAGYLFAYPFATYFIGWMSEKFNSNNQNSWYAFAITLLFGALFIDFCGAVGVSILSDVTLSKSLIASLAFIPGDAIKAFLAAIIAKRISNSLGQRKD